jgi:5-methylcytosine-specific restriction endonuclease McrA
VFLKPSLIYGERCDANASEAENMTIFVAPTETEREGLTNGQYATVRTQANQKPERSTEMIDPYLTKSKVCCRCRVEKPLADFYSNKSTKDGFQKECKSCHSEAQMKWQSQNREKANEIARRYNQGRRKGYVQEILEKLKDYQKTYHKEWRAENPDKCFEYKVNRRARVLNAGGAFTAKQFSELCGKHGNKCLSCGKTEDRLHADHIIPISRGGSNGIENIQPLCRNCNMRKGTKTIDFR